MLLNRVELKSLINVLVRSVRTISAQWFPALRINKAKAVKAKVVMCAIIYQDLYISRNESQPGQQQVEKLATPLRRIYRQKLHRVMIIVWIKPSHFDYTLFFHINAVFSGQAEYSYFSADFSLMIFMYYS